MVRRVTLSLATLAALVIAPAASAVEPYQDVAGQSQGVVQADTLPFTGLNLALIVLAGIMLIGTGIVLMRRNRSAGQQ